jgi:hypothetical protein
MCSNISEHDHWPAFAQVFHALKESPELLNYLTSEKKNGIYQHSVDSPQIQELAGQLTARAQVQWNLCRLETSLPTCCPIIRQLKVKIEEISASLISYPRQLTDEQKARLESARGVFLDIPEKAIQNKYTGENVNCLIELAMTQLLFDFYSAPSRVIEVDHEIEEQLIKLVRNSSVSTAQPMTLLEYSKGNFIFYDRPIQTASRIKVAAEIALSLGLPVLCPAVVNHEPLEVDKELKHIAKAVKDKDLLSSCPSAIKDVIARLDQLPSTFTDAIKDLLGRWVTGAEENCTSIGEKYLRDMTTSTNLQELGEAIETYLRSPEFREANRLYLIDHPTFSGLLFPFFDTQQNKSENIKEKTQFPIAFQHLCFLYHLITKSNSNSPNLFFNVANGSTEEFSFIELNHHFSPSTPVFEHLALDQEIATPLIATLVDSGAFEKVKKHLAFQNGLASGPLKEAERRVDIIESTLKDAIECKASLTPTILIEKIFITT